MAYHFIREQVAQFSNLNIVPISTDFQLADLFTKVLPAPRFQFLVNSISGLNPAPLTPRTVSETVSDKLSDMKETMMSLKERLQKDPTDPVHVFHDNHFQEPDPISLQAQAGLHQARLNNHIASSAAAAQLCKPRFSR